MSGGGRGRGGGEGSGGEGVVEGGVSGGGREWWRGEEVVRREW